MEASKSVQRFNEARDLGEHYAKLLGCCATQFHTVNLVKQVLSGKGFTELREIDAWDLSPGRGYYFSRNNSTIGAFTVGSSVAAFVSKFKIIGCHTDSPVLKLAPVSKAGDRAGFQQLTVQLYGGGLWHTWFDRDLTLAGKIIVRDLKTGAFSTRYWHKSDHAILKVPNLAIHLTDRSGNFEPNKEAHTKPILATSIVSQIFGGDVQPTEEDVYACEDKHYRELLKAIGSDLGIDPKSIVDFELNVVDTQPPALIGLHKEFLSSPRLDNLGSSLVAMDALIEAHIAANDEVNMILLFDHEEVGSQSAQGADSNLAVETTTRIFESLSKGKGSHSDYYRAIRQSFLISADMAHGLHPNYQEKHQSSHAPRLHQGIVLKTNANQRYMTDVIGATIIRAVAAKAEPEPVPIQDFIVRNDSACGSTIGPLMASKAGIKTADIGAPMLGMHSIRETCGVLDLLYYRRLFVAFFNHFGNLPAELFTE
jgi:aspartyl aminopeptidase